MGTTKKKVSLDIAKTVKVEVLRGTIGYFYTRADGTQRFLSCEAGYIAEMDTAQAEHLVDAGVAKYVDEKKLSRLKAMAKKAGIAVKANWSSEKIASELEKKGAVL